MANYSVDIQVGIKGAQKVTKFRQEINRTAKEVDGLNKQIRRAAGNKFENSIDRLNASVNKTSGILNRAAIGTKSFTKAAQLFVKAERERDMVLQKTQKTLENAKRSQLGMQSVEEREHQLLMRGNKLRELRLRRDRQLQKQRRLQGATSNALIGGAFPLLFGQGAGASVGGALGGFAGGMLGGQFGFALSLVGTSLGSAVDKFVDGARKVGQAMNENAKEFDRVQNIIGKKGADKLSAFASSTKTLSKTFGDFILDVQSGVAGLINMSGVLNRLIAKMQRSIAERQVKRSEDFKRRTKNLGVRSAGGRSGGKTQQRNVILNEMTDVQFEKNVQSFADSQALTGDQMIQRTIQGLEREGFLHDANTEKMRQALEIRFEFQDITEKIIEAGGVLSDDQKNYIHGLIREKHLRKENLDLQKFLKENAKEMRSLEDEDQKNYDDAIKKLDKLKESANAITENMAKQNELNLVKLTGDEYQIALKEHLLSLKKGELASFDEEKFKIEFNNKLRIDGLMKQKQLTEEITNMMAQGMGNAIKGLITGTQSLNDTLRNVLNSMANAFLNFGLFGNFGGTFTRGSGLLGAIFRAEGGPVKRGGSYIVGERGPEIFTPGVSGKITPNHAMGDTTNIVVNVDASGSNVQSEGDGQQFGQALATAIQLEIVKQKRSGGLLA